MLIVKAAPCLATGNVLIVKPSERSPLGSLAIAPLFEEAGFPNGVLQVVTGAGPTGALLASHMRIRKVRDLPVLPWCLLLTLYLRADQFHRQCCYRQENPSNGSTE